MNITKIPLSILMLMACSVCATQAQPRVGDFDTKEKVYEIRPSLDKSSELGQIGPTGILARVDIGVKVTVTGTQEGSPAEGKFKAKEVITGVNGQSLAGYNPFVILGNAITAAEATDGKLVFDVESTDGKRKQAVQIPVLGEYGKNWPVDCPKSSKIIANAASYYANLLKTEKNGGIGGALACLFLLSTGDDQYLPLVKNNYQGMMDQPKKIGDHTWNNGYNGIACAEYYFRTGDKDMLPVLQAFCDDARDRQNFDSAWKHWGTDLNPAYVAGGLMNPASVPVLTTLILSKEAGVNVDEKTLMNALRYFYRFAGHGSVAYGDHRGEGGIASNGKDAMLAAAMQAAMGAAGDTTSYEMARDSLSMATLDGYSGMIKGHGDWGRGDGIWRGIASAYLMEKAPERFREVMDRIAWWYDLSRSHDGSMGMATVSGWSTRTDSGGAGALLLFTSPLKTLRITGAPRSKYAKEFQLPARIWGKKADLEFLKVTPVEGYESFGKPEPTHNTFRLLGSAYGAKKVIDKSDEVSLDQLNRYVRHNSYTIRTQAARALRVKGETKALEELLTHPDPRMRRAGLDGILDWKYWSGGSGKQPLAPQEYTPGMVKAITTIINNPDEATFVIDAALFVMSFMPAEVIEENYDLINQWSKHQDWWLRQGAFEALLGFQKDPKTLVKVVPQLVDMMTAENHTMPRSSYNRNLLDLLKKSGRDSEVGKLLAEGFEQSVVETHIEEGRREPEGSFNIYDAITNAIKIAPDLAPELVESLAERGLTLLDDKRLIELTKMLVGGEGLVSASSKLNDSSKQRLAEVIEKSFIPEVTRRLKASGGKDIQLIDALIAIKESTGDDAGWAVIGSPSPAERQWEYLSFHPTDKKDILPKRDGRRYRQIQLPSGLEGWYEPSFKPKGWQSGRAPIGKGSHPRGGKNPPTIASPWGEGEILLARTTFEIDKLVDYDIYRLRVLSQQGFNVYLNGKSIRTYGWWQDPGQYRSWPMSENQSKLLKIGTNTLAIYTAEVYPSAQKPHWKSEVYGLVDLRIEGLKFDELYK